MADRDRQRVGGIGAGVVEHEPVDPLGIQTDSGETLSGPALIAFSRERDRIDVSRARELMGFEAEVPLEEGLRRTVDWFAGQLSAREARVG